MRRDHLAACFKTLPPGGSASKGRGGRGSEKKLRASLDEKWDRSLFAALGRMTGRSVRSLLVRMDCRFSPRESVDSETLPRVRPFREFGEKVSVDSLQPHEFVVNSGWYHHPCTDQAVNNPKHECGQSKKN